MAKQYDLPTSAFLVLSLIGEGQTHGYELEKLIKNRGFRYWTDVQKTSIYNALKFLEKKRLITARLEDGGGPTRKVYRITDAGLKQLSRDGLAHLAAPAHPRNEVDLGMYVLPFLKKEDALEAIEEGLRLLNARLEFIRERLKWCEERKLELPILAFERPMVALEVEIQWLKRVKQRISKSSKGGIDDGWKAYEYREPPYAD